MVNLTFLLGFRRITAPLSAAVALVSCNLESTAYHPETTPSTESNSGRIVVSSTSFNTLNVFGSDGTYVERLRDLNYPLETPYGLALNSTGNLLVAIDGVDRIESVSTTSGSYSNAVLNSQLTSNTLGGVAVSANDEILVAEMSTNTIEKFTSAGIRVGAPFIGTTVGGCTLNTPRKIVVLPDGKIAVTSAGNHRLNIYNSDGTCSAAVTAAPFGSNAPYGLAFDITHNLFIVAFNTSSRIYSVTPNGATITQIYYDTGVISAPTALTIDPDGNLLVANTGLDSIEKLRFDGVTATRVGSTPFIPPSAYMRDPWDIVVLP